MHVSLKVAAGLALSTALAAPSFAVAPSDLSMNPSIGTDTFEFMTGLNFESARGMGTSSTRAIFGDTFTAGVFGQNTLAATSLDGGPDTFSFFSNPASGGSHTFTGAGTLYRGFWTTGGEIAVSAFTFDGSDWLPSFTDPGDGGGNMTRLRFDVGSFAAGLDPIGTGEFIAASAQFVLFSGGVAVFSTSSVIFDAGASGLTGSAIVSGVDGNNIDEVQMIFTLVPAPGAASLLGLAGLAAIRRRR